LAADLAHRLGVRSVRRVVCDLSTALPLAAAYDRILLDAPCSGLGVLRRHPEARWRPRPDVAELAALQARLADRLIPLVKPGGLFVYAVCTYTDEEGPAQAARLCALHPELSIEPPPAPLSSLADATGATRTWPHRHDADAFYAVRLRRRA
jgi:16S rRNA (cytosine967-C5)-methyltransferase